MRYKHINICKYIFIIIYLKILRYTDWYYLLKIIFILVYVGIFSACVNVHAEVNIEHQTLWSRAGDGC